MKTQFDRLLEDPDDDRLIEIVAENAMRIISRGDAVIVPCAHVVRVLDLAEWFANGDFELFIESVRAPSEFGETVAALRAVGATAAADATELLLSVFPGSCPPVDIEDRIRIMEELVDKHEDVFFPIAPHGLSYQELRPSIANYIRAHGKDFAPLFHDVVLMDARAPFPGYNACVREMATWCADVGLVLEVRLTSGLLVSVYDDLFPEEEMECIETITVRNARRDNDDIMTKLSAWPGAVTVRSAVVHVDPPYVFDLAVLSRFEALLLLDVKSESLGDSELEAISMVRSLVDLRIESSGRCGRGLRTLNRLQDLQRLELSGLEASVHGLRVFEQLRIEELAIAGLAVDGGFPRMQLGIDIRRLEMSHIELEDRSLAWVSGTLLETLSIQSVALDVRAWGAIGRLRNLRSLSLADCDLTEEGLCELQGLESLCSIRLEGIDLSESGARALSKLKTLKKLVIDSVSSSGREVLRTSLAGVDLKVN